jgi:hypothetical protein
MSDSDKMLSDLYEYAKRIADSGQSCRLCDNCKNYEPEVTEWDAVLVLHEVIHGKQLIVAKTDDDIAHSLRRVNYVCISPDFAKEIDKLRDKYYGNVRT